MTASPSGSSTSPPPPPSPTAEDDLFDASLRFEDLGVDGVLLRAVEKLKYTHPTLIQAALIPLALAGRDVLGQSRTGSGKTAAFGLPILQGLLHAPCPFGALILCPTRELAIQVAHEMRNLGRFTELQVVAVYGGQRMSVQGPKLRRGPEVIVGTPGRIMDFHRRGALPYDKLRYAVLDEVDRMLDIGFREDIRRILGSLRQKHQTMLVSATISEEIERLARRYLRDPEKLVFSSSTLTVAEVVQHYFSVERWDKSRLLVHLLKHKKPALTLIFCRTKQTVDALSRYLARKGIDARAIHGDLQQGKRNRVMSKLRAGELEVLVASDLAARGLDVDDISHVINYDLPEDPEVYVHRIGRTARVGREGVAWSFVTPEQGELLTNIEMLTNVEIRSAEYGDFQPGPVPETVVNDRRREAERKATIKVDHKRDRVAPPSQEESVDPCRFPGGIVPVALPSRRLGGRLRSRRR